MGKIRVPDKEFYLSHLSENKQYSNSRKWILWYARVAKFKALRTAQIICLYKDKKAKVLDLGCGVGLTLSILAQKFPNIVGCDIDQEALDATKKVLKKVGVNIRLILYDGRKLPFKNNEFDVVTCIEVIEHVQNHHQFLKEIYRVLKKDGILHITTANKWWPYEPHFKLFFLSYLPENLANFYVRLSGKGKSYHGIKLPSYGKFKQMLNRDFYSQDITLDIIEDYKKYNFDKERGKKVIIIGEFLRVIKNLDNTFLFFLPKLIRGVLLRVSLGWLFIAKPKK